MLENAELNADSAMGAFGYRFLSNLYNVGTLGFASVHDPQRDAYDEGKISGGEYLTKGVAGGGAMVAANVLTGRAAGAAMAGKGLLAQSAIASGSGAVLGAGNDAAMQGSRIGAGQQDSYNVNQTLTATAGGAVLGGAAPGAGVLVQKAANSLSKVKVGNFFTREAKGGPGGANGANQGGLKGKSDSVTRQSDATAVEVHQASAKTKVNNQPKSDNGIRQFETPHKPLTPKVKREIKSKVKARTATKEEVKRLDWDRRFNNRRKRGVDRFWRGERKRLMSGEQGTRSWTPEQRQQILDYNKTNRAPTFDGKPIEGHHKHNALDHPQAADDAQNIYPATDKEHFNRWHGGNYRNDTYGKPLDPGYPEEF